MGDKLICVSCAGDAIKRGESLSHGTCSLCGENFKRDNVFPVENLRQLTVGMDEAGVGCIAGPLVCVAYGVEHTTELPADVRDSKRLSEGQREELIDSLYEAANFVYIRVAHPKEINSKSNIWAVWDDLTASLLREVATHWHVDVIVDGSRIIEKPPSHAVNGVMTIRYEVKGDARFREVSAASIIAKHIQTCCMEDLHDQFPIYGFNKHKGYPTTDHLAVLNQRGPCLAHRTGYKPVKAVIKKLGILPGQLALDLDSSTDAVADNVGSTERQSAQSIREGQSRERETISSFRGLYRFLSNFFDSVIDYEGIRYATVEHAYQAAKTTDTEVRRAFARAVTPGLAKKKGRAIALRPDWEEVKFDIMLELLRLKFADDPLRQLLLDTGDALLIEGNTWGDRVWGAVWEGRSWVGENNLGRLLMQVREELRKPTEPVLDKPRRRRRPPRRKRR